MTDRADETPKPVADAEVILARLGAYMKRIDQGDKDWLPSEFEAAHESHLDLGVRSCEGTCLWWGSFEVFYMNRSHGLVRMMLVFRGAPVWRGFPDGNGEWVESTAKRLWVSEVEQLVRRLDEAVMGSGGDDMPEKELSDKVMETALKIMAGDNKKTEMEERGARALAAFTGLPPYDTMQEQSKQLGRKQARELLSMLQAAGLVVTLAEEASMYGPTGKMSVQSWTTDRHQ